VALKEFLTSKPHRYTPHTVTRAASLEAELERVREQGWASTAEEFEIGLNAVAAPIFGTAGEVLAAVGTSGPSYRLTVESFPAVAAALVGGAKEISGRLGYFGRGPQPSP
jgi:DNA-binding IclR family transcriptional regulator